MVIGLGYVGLPLAHAATSSGLRVIGFDVDRNLTQGLMRGKSHVDDLTDDQVRGMTAKGFRATSDASVIHEADVVVICVPTPLTASGNPDLSNLRSAAESVSCYLRQGQLVILESTTYPGTTEEFLVPVLQESGLKAGTDFHVAYSPERVDPGNSHFNMGNTPKVVGGIDGPSTIAAADFYRNFVPEIVQARGLREAELAKLIENTYRYVNIALVNELAKFCHELEIDIWDALRCAATKPFGFESFVPGPGVGGHCIPIDPNYLAHRIRERTGSPFRMVELAREINRSMPSYIADRVSGLLDSMGRSVSASRILLLGVTYKPDISDERESPARPLAELLLSRGAELAYHDAYVQKWTVNGQDIPRLSQFRSDNVEFDLIVLLQAHREYLHSDLGKGSVAILDTRGVVSGPAVSPM